MGCCGGGDDEKQEGMAKERKCRDVLCLLLFLVFWAGMFVVCAIAVDQGDFNRIIYGTDSFGLTCGSTTTYLNQTVDLSARKNLYYLNPMDLINPLNLMYAKSICVAKCPGSGSTCGFDSLPCKNDSQFACPYYKVSDKRVAGRLTGVDDWDTDWYMALSTMSAGQQDPAAVQMVAALQNLNIGWINDFIASVNIGDSSNGNVTGGYYQLRSNIPNNGPCYPVWIATTDYFNRCFPDVEKSFKDALKSVNGAAAAVREAAFSDEFNDVADNWSRYVADISKGILIIVVAGLVAGVVISLVWLLILRYMAGLMAWLIILFVNVALVGITLYCFSMAGLLGDNSVAKEINDVLDNIGNPAVVETDTWKVIAIASAIVAGIVFLICLLMISRVKIAVACMKVASQAVGQMPLILLFPLLPFLFMVGLLIYWVAITGLLYSAGDLTAHCRSAAYQPFTFSNFSSTDFLPTYSAPPANNTCYKDLSRDEMSTQCGQDPNCYLTFAWNDNLKYAFIYHFFGLLWTSQFIIGFGCVTIAGAIGSYYWARGDTAQMPRFPVLTALKNTTIYHMGSVAFGSLIIAIIMFIRYLLDYMDRKTKELQEGNKLAEWLMCCCKCCMWCLEKIVMFINRNAYIIVAVKGSNYCMSAGRALKLLIGNALRIAAINVVGDLLIFLGKVAVAACCGMIAFGLSELDFYNNPSKYPETYLYSPVLPVAVCIFAGFVIASIFFSVYEMAIDTIILAFCEDCENGDGTPKYAPPLLMEALGLDPSKAPEKGADNTGKPIKG